jgi:hypothetical protein
MNAQQQLRRADEAVSSIEDEDLRCLASAIVESNKAVVAAIEALRSLVDKRV